MPNPNDDFSLILTKAKKAGFFEDVQSYELGFLSQEARKLFGTDSGFSRKTYKLRALANTLKNPFTSVGVQVTGDSTNTPDTAWFRLLANQCSSEYPALTHHYRKWNDTSQDFDRPIVLNTGSAGRRAMVMATGGTRVGVKYDGSTNIVGDLDVRVDLKLTNWATGTSQVVAAKYDTDSSWYFQVGGDGKLYFNWSTDGSTFVGIKASSVVVPFANNTEGWIRVTLTVNNGASGNDVKFYTSVDGITWTQLGTTVTTAGVTSIFAGTSRYSLGARGASSTPVVDSSRIYEVQIRDGINGPSVVPYFPDMWENTIGTGISYLEGSPIITWVMSAMPGAGLGYDAQTVGYLSDPVRMKKMAPNFNQVAYFFSSSHNEYSLHGNLWAQKYKTWMDTISANALLAERIILTQNPRTGSADDIISANGSGLGPRIRRSEMFSLAKRLGVDIIDTYQAFIDDGRDLSTILISDTIHPTSEGYIIWKDAVKNELDASLTTVSSVS